MKKILLASLLVASAGFAADSIADHEAKMQKMQERTQTRVKDGSGKQIRNQYQHQTKNSYGKSESSDSSSKKMYKEYKGQSGAGNTRGVRGGKGR